MSGLTASNHKVQRLRRLLGRRGARVEEGAFVIEGAVLVREAISAGLDIEAIYAGPGTPEDLLAARVPVVELAAGVVERVATAVTPQPVLAVARTCDVPLASLVGASFVVVAARLGDPGNVGTILRVAEAAGAHAVALTEGSVDPFNPKVVRASAGALFHVPVVVGVSLDEVRGLGLRLLGAAADGPTPYDEVDWSLPTAIVLGNEAQGLSLEERALCDGLVAIPHAGRAESLNVAMAAAVLCFAAAAERGR